MVAAQMGQGKANSSFTVREKDNFDVNKRPDGITQWATLIAG